MSTTSIGPRVQTRLSLTEYARFQKTMDRLNLNQGQLARDAICFYLDALDNETFDKRETLLEKRLKRMEDRLAALLAKANIDIGVVIGIMYKNMDRETRDEEIKTAHKKAVERWRKKLKDDDGEKDQIHSTASATK